MGRINIVLSDETEHRLSRAIVDTNGGRKGNLSEAIERAIMDWLRKDEARKARR